jgi:hypothetical protein
MRSVGFYLVNAICNNGCSTKHIVHYVHLHIWCPFGNNQQVCRCQSSRFPKKRNTPSAPIPRACTWCERAEMRGVIVLRSGINKNENAKWMRGHRGLHFSPWSLSLAGRARRTRGDMCALAVCIQHRRRLQLLKGWRRGGGGCDVRECIDRIAICQSAHALDATDLR